MALVSVIVPCFNHARFLQDAVYSILRQTHRDLEVIIVDDGSHDCSADVIRELEGMDTRIQSIRNKRNFGPSRSRNDGLLASRGEFIGFCDADDIWLPEKLARQVSLLQMAPEFGVTYCDSEIVDEWGVKTGRKFSDEYSLPVNHSGDIFNELCVRNFINTQSVLVRRDVSPSSGWFDERIRCSEDWWLWLRFAKLTKFKYDPTVLAKYRVHSLSTSRTQRMRYQRDRWKVCKRNLRTHTDMLLHLQGVMWYTMGYALVSIDRKRRGRKFMLHGLYCFIRGRGSVRRLLQMSARIGFLAITGITDSVCRS